MKYFFIVVTVVIALLIWALAGFVSWEWSPSQWDVEERFIATFVWAALSFLCITFKDELKELT